MFQTWEHDLFFPNVLPIRLHLKSKQMLLISKSTMPISSQPAAPKGLAKGKDRWLISGPFPCSGAEAQMTSNSRSFNLNTADIWGHFIHCGCRPALRGCLAASLASTHDDSDTSPAVITNNVSRAHHSALWSTNGTPLRTPDARLVVCPHLVSDITRLVETGKPSINLRALLKCQKPPVLKDVYEIQLVSPLSQLSVFAS